MSQKDTSKTTLDGCFALLTSWFFNPRRIASLRRTSEGVWFQPSIPFEVKIANGWDNTWKKLPFGFQIPWNWWSLIKFVCMYMLFLRVKAIVAAVFFHNLWASWIGRGPVDGWNPAKVGMQKSNILYQACWNRLNPGISIKHSNIKHIGIGLLYPDGWWVLSSSSSTGGPSLE